MISSQDAIPAFLAAAETARGALTHPGVAANWAEPSTLPSMTVGAVAGHVYLIVRRVDLHLDDQIDESLQPVIGLPDYPRVNGPDDLDHDVHATVRDDGQRVSDWGPSAVCQSFDDRLHQLASRLDERVPQAVAMGPFAVPFGDYLASRVVELLTHADDLLVGVGAQVDPPTVAIDVAVRYLTTTARALHGDRAVLLGFTRRERVANGAPFVF